MTMGRPKLENPRNKHIDLRVTEIEFKKISRVAKQKNLTKTEAILRGIDLLERDKPKRYKNLHKKTVKTPNGDIDADILEFL